MKKVNPYKTTKNAVAALDNGGRFYNWSSKEGDGEITSAELRKAAGVITGAQSMILYLEMSLANFDREEKSRVLSFLTPELKERYQQDKPGHLLTSEDAYGLDAGAGAIFTGVPKLVDSKSEFTGFITVPIHVGSTMTFTMVPIIEAFDIYELHPNEGIDDFFVGHNQSRRKLPQGRLRLAGVLKEVSESSDGSGRKGRFLEITHYTVLS